MGSRYIVTLTAVLCSLMFFLPNLHAQVVVPTGNATEASSQLIYYYDLESGNSQVQITNTNDTNGVWIHVKIFRNFDATGEGDLVICDERNFVDFLTPNDTHVYSISEDNFPKNIGETEVAPGESTAIVDLDGTRGFIVITPVVSNVDLTAISFDHLVGKTLDDSSYFLLNAMGRSAYDFATGEKLSDGVPLDGITNGYELLQPAELIFDFAGDEGTADVVGIVFTDVYGDPGLLGYEIVPGTATWTSFIFDYKESPTSCGVRNIECFISVGLNDTFTQYNTDLSLIDDDLLCGGSTTPEHPASGDNLNDDFGFFGWTRIFVSGVSGFENHLGVFYQSESFEDAKWMNTRE